MYFRKNYHFENKYCKLIIYTKNQKLLFGIFL